MARDASVAAQRMSLCPAGDSICIVTQHEKVDPDGVKGGYVVPRWPVPLCIRRHGKQLAICVGPDPPLVLRR